MTISGRWAGNKGLTSRVCIKLGLMASFMRIAREPVAPMSSQVMGSPPRDSPMTIFPSLDNQFSPQSASCLAGISQRKRSSPVSHVREIVAERKDSHTFGSNSDVETSDEGSSHLSRGLSSRDFSKVTIVGVENSVPARGNRKGFSTASVCGLHSSISKQLHSPRDLLGVNIETSEFRDFVVGEVVRVGFGNSQLFETLEHDGSESSLSLRERTETVEQLLSNRDCRC